MANVAAHYSLTIRDGLGVEASTVAYVVVPDTTTLAGIAAAAGTWALDVDATIDGAITGLRVELAPALPGGLKAATGATWAASRVEQTGVLNFKNATTKYRFGMPLPSIRSDVISTGKIDLTDTAIAALITLLTSGAFSNTAQQALTALVDAIISFRKRRKQLQRSSFEV